MSTMQRPATRFTRTRSGFVAVMAVALAAAVAWSAPAAAQPPQIPLTAEQVEGFIKGNREVSALFAKIEDAESPDPKMLDALDEAARKYGFKDFADFDQVAETIDVVMEGIDPRTRQFTQPPDRIKKQIAEAEANKRLSEEDRKELLEELHDALEGAQVVQHPDNVALVIKYYSRIYAVRR
jgi:hypothetical protein